MSVAARDFVTIAFMQIFVVKSLGVGEDDARAFAAGDGQTRIGGGEGLAIEEHVDVSSWRDVAGQLGSGPRVPIALVGEGCPCESANESCQALWVRTPCRQQVWNQAPGIVAGSVSGVRLVYVRIDALANG